jgi:hypothetical protein
MLRRGVCTLHGHDAGGSEARPYGSGEKGDGAKESGRSKQRPYLPICVCADIYWDRRACVWQAGAELDFDQDQGDVVGWGAFAPLGYAVQDAFLHFVEGQEGCFADDFLDAFDA